MKTSATYLSLMMGMFAIPLSLVPVYTSAQHIPLEKKSIENRHDPDFPGRTKFNAGVITTYTNTSPPPAIIGDVTYGIKDRFSIGAIAGTTGAQSLAGLKINAVLLQRTQFRMMYRMVIIYYPGRNGQYLFDRSDKHIVPWMLSMGVIDAEWRTPKGIRWSLGMGLLETHCVEGMKKYFGRSVDETRTMPFEFFHTVQGSVSLPISNRLTFRPEVFVVMKDARLIHTGDFKVHPINPFLKLIYTF